MCITQPGLGRDEAAAQERLLALLDRPGPLHDARIHGHVGPADLVAARGAEVPAALHPSRGRPRPVRKKEEPVAYGQKKNRERVWGKAACMPNKSLCHVVPLDVFDMSSLESWFTNAHDDLWEPSLLHHWARVFICRKPLARRGRLEATGVRVGIWTDYPSSLYSKCLIGSDKGRKKSSKLFLSSNQLQSYAQ